MRIKIKSYRNQAVDFHGEEIPKIGSNYIYLTIALIDLVLKKDKKYYLKVFLEECKYI